MNAGMLPESTEDTLAQVRRHVIRYTDPLPSSLVDPTTKPSFFFSTPEITPLAECDLCRLRHNVHYADARIMPM